MKKEKDGVLNEITKELNYVERIIVRIFFKTFVKVYNKTRIDMAVQWLPTAIIIFFAYMIIFGGVVGTIFKKRDIT